MNKLKSILVLGFMCIGLLACGDSAPSSSVTTRDPRPNSYYDPDECQRLDRLGTGIRGNSACPYRGEYDENRGYQEYVINYESQLDFRLGAGYRIDFGWDNDWENACPNQGEVPVFVNGRFNHCDMANPSYADPHDGTNTSSCAGSQYSPELTRCTPFGIRPTGDDGTRYIY